MVVRKKQRRKKSRYQKGQYSSKKSGETYKYRSGWELVLMAFLDEDEETVAWSYEKIVIEYVSNAKTGRKRKYYPDFYVELKSGERQLIEVKPTRKLANRVVKKKLSAAADWCRDNQMTLRIITERELKELGLL